MGTRLLMGNEAIALGALRAGVQVVSGYPGTPSTEVLETIAKAKTDGVYVEWSVNEKVALEVAAGAAYAGARTMVTMKQMGLNVASDPLMCLAYIGVRGGTVILVADDPGPISSQTEQDTRRFARYAKLPVFDPSTVEEAYEMIYEAFLFSEQHNTPVLFRPTTRVCHSCACVDVADEAIVRKTPEFVRDTSRWVIFPKLSYARHAAIERELPAMGDELSAYPRNKISEKGEIGIVASGVSRTYVAEALGAMPNDVSLLEIVTANPFPEKLAKEFLDGVTRVLVIEELDPVIEDALNELCGRQHLDVTILGKRSGQMPFAGEYSSELVASAIAELLGVAAVKSSETALPKLPIRPPVLCAGCPHRASFYAV
ncbi:MAG: indolepyruvate ferredoxin oxidoreductase subunit alpha, partial [Clostridia bacterium]